MSTPGTQLPRTAAPLAPYMALAGIWLLTLTIVPPRGDFPLNDDWMYAKVVQHLVQTGEYQATPYADPTFILQAYWGAAFVKLFDFSFETLRISTLILGLVAIWAAHWAAREAGLTTRWAFLVALTLLVNPLFLNLSYTFMTDVPFLALSLLAAAAYLRALRTNQAKWIAIGTALMGLSFLVRQFAVVLLLAYVPVAILTFDRRKALATTSALVGPLIVTGVLYALSPVGGLGVSGGWDWSLLGNSWIDRFAEILRHCSIAFTYLALFSAPLFTAVAISKSFGTGPAKTIALRIALVAVPSLAILLLMYPQWPYRLPNLGNLLYDFGVGPLLLPGMVEGSAIAAPLRLGPLFWWVITILAIPRAAAFAVLHVRTGIQLPSKWRTELTARADFLLALWSIGLVLVLIMPPVLARFDRYFVMAQIPAMILAARWLAAQRPKPSHMAFAVAGIFWVLAVVSLQDYLAWNGARWRALDALQRDHAAPLEQINGGYEFNGWYQSDVYAEESRKTGKKIFGPQGWWIRGDEFRVSLRPNKRFEVIGTEPYFSWLGWKQREILLLHRTEPDPSF